MENHTGILILITHAFFIR